MNKLVNIILIILIFCILTGVCFKQKEGFVKKNRKRKKNRNKKKNRKKNRNRKKNIPICPDGSKAVCKDQDKNCFDGDDDWYCNGYFYCSNDSKSYAKQKGGILCSEINKKSNFMKKKFKKLDAEDCGSEDGDKWTGKCINAKKHGKGTFTFYKKKNGNLIKDYEQIGNFVNDKLNDENGKEIWYKLENDQSIKEYEKIGKFEDNELHDGKEIWYKYKNGQSIKKYEYNGNFVDDELNDENGKEIWYKYENGESIKKYEFNGKFINNKLNDKNGKLIWYKLENGNPIKNHEYNGNFIDNKLNDEKGKIIYWDKLENGDFFIKLEKIGKFKDNELNDINGKIIAYKINNKDIYISSERYGVLENGKFKKGKKIVYKIKNDKPFIDYEEIGNFKDDKLYGEEEELIFYDIKNNKIAEYKGVFENGKFKKGEKIGYKIKNGESFKNYEAIGNFRDNKLYGDAELIFYDIKNNKIAEYKGVFENNKFKKGKKTKYKLKNGKVIIDYVEIGTF